MTEKKKPVIIDVPAEHVHQAIDGDPQYTLIDKCIGKLASIVSVLTAAKKTRKVPKATLEVMPEVYELIEAAQTSLDTSLKNGTIINTLVKSTDPNGLPAPVSRKRKIDELGLGDQVIRLRKQGWSLEQIGEDIGLSADAVSEWLQEYATRAPEQRLTDAKENSVFNITERLQEHQELISRLLRRMEAEDIKDSGVPLAMLVGELTKVYKLSFEMMEKVENMNRKDRLMQAFLSRMDFLAPGIRREVELELQRLVKEGSGGLDK